MEKFIKLHGRLPTEVDSDYLEMLEMSRYLIQDTPYYKPHKCSNCGSAKQDGRKYVNTGLELDFYGIVYFCTLCLDDIAKTVGLYNQYILQIEELKKIRNDLIAQNLQQEHLHERLENTMRQFKEFYDHVYIPSMGRVNNSVNSDSGTLAAVESKNDSTVSASNSTSRRADFISEGAEPESVKSTDVSRPKNIRSLTDLIGN